MNKIFSTISIFVFLTVGVSGCASVGETFTDNTVKKPISEALDSSLQADVQTTVSSVQLWLGSHTGATSIPTTGNDSVAVTNSEPSNTVTVVGNWEAWSVVGKNMKTGYSYKYDSTTGQYS